ncbi:MAG: SpoIIE family protein phosphatase [Clostridia bacterium]|nr:SpoIIE family protein phosphatase [Clostridia bacterium]
MLLKRKNYDYLSVLRYIFLFFVFAVFNNLEGEVYPYSFAPLVASLGLGASPIITTILFMASFLVTGSFGLLASAGIGAGVNVITFLIYKRFKIKPKYELILFAFATIIGYVALGNTTINTPFLKRIFLSVTVIILSLVLFVAGKTISEKGLKIKLGKEEYSAVAISVVAFGLGVCNLILPEVWKGVSVLILLLCCYLFRTGITTLISATLGISLALYYGDINYIAIFLAWGICAECLMPLSRYVSALAIAVLDFVLELVFGIYGGYSLITALPIFCGVVIFCLIPTKPIKRLKEKLYTFREKQLSRQSINRNRVMLANKLYDLSGVFTEMASAFNAFKKNTLTEDKAKIIMEKNVKNSACHNCNNKEKCKLKQESVAVGINKMIDIGFAKGKLSLIDLPKELGEICIHPNEIIYGLNKLLAEYRNYLMQNKNLSVGRQLIADEASGIAEVLRSLALESGALLKYHSRLERIVSENLLKKGFPVSELLIYGENESLSVGIILTAKELPLELLERTISSTLSFPMTISERVTISQDKFYIHLKQALDYSAVFGLAKVKKDGSQISGDTHSVTKIGNDKLLVALSDGMGSGVKAETVASTSLSLIESFYKAGLSSTLILNTVNKLLAVNTEDSFTALDIGVIDLKDCSADFIKYGAPYGFIINENGIKIVEGNSLPLGILDELKPAVCTTKLEDGDMVLLVTDGISDAFGSSGDIIDYLRTVPAKNPQTLADDILKKALSLSGGARNDDMTALAVRVFKRVA